MSDMGWSDLIRRQEAASYEECRENWLRINKEIEEVFDEILRLSCSNRGSEEKRQSKIAKLEARLDRLFIEEKNNRYWEL